MIEEIPKGTQAPRPRARHGTLRFLAAMGTVAMLVLGAATLAHGADGAVSIVDFAFQPPTVTIDAGGTVSWTVTQAQDPHTVSPVDPPDGFVGSPLLHQGDHFSVTFTEAGTYRYQCTIHPEDMQGTVIVQAAQSTPTATAIASEPPPTTTSGPPATGTPAPTGSSARQEPSGAGPPLIAVVLAVLSAVGVGVAGWFLVMRRPRG